MSSVSRHDESHNEHCQSNNNTVHNHSVTHAHTHTHDHNEGEASPAFSQLNEGETSPAPFLLKYMLEHNTHHGEELLALAHQLEDAGTLASADAVKRALEYYEQGNAELATAIEQL